nr:hypothetical protein [Tanacetum cinerariifolium]
MAVRTQPSLSLGMPARIEKEFALSLSSFRKRYRSSYKTPSPSSSPTLPIWKRYQGTSEPIKDTKDESLDSDAKRDSSKGKGHSSEGEGHGLEDESISLEEEETVPKGQQQAVLVVDTTMNEPLGFGYKALRRRELALGEGSVPSTFEVGQSSRVYTDILTYVPPAAPVQTSPSPEWSSSSLPVSPSSLVVPSPIALLVTTPAATISRLDAVPSTLFEGYGRDLMELYTRSREARDGFFSQRYRLRSLEHEQERATVTFRALWRQVLALEA